MLVWWATGDRGRLSATADAAIDAAGPGDLAVSSISAWEIAMLVAHGRLALTMDTKAWIATLGDVASIRFVPIDNAIAIESVELPPPFHQDPADRMIIATARRLNIPVVTADDKIRDYPHVRVIW